MGHSGNESLYFGLLQDASYPPVARRFGIKDAVLIILSLIVIGILMRESYERGAEDGYWEAIEEENPYACEIFDV